MRWMLPVLCLDTHLQRSPRTQVNSRCWGCVARHCKGLSQGELDHILISRICLQTWPHYIYIDNTTTIFDKKIMVVQFHRRQVRCRHQNRKTLWTALQTILQTTQTSCWKWNNNEIVIIKQTTTSKWQVADGSNLPVHGLPWHALASPLSARTCS